MVNQRIIYADYNGISGDVLSFLCWIGRKVAISGEIEMKDFDVELRGLLEVLYDDSISVTAFEKFLASALAASWASNENVVSARKDVTSVRF